jgi:hypothetical protein
MGACGGGRGRMIAQPTYAVCGCTLMIFRTGNINHYKSMTCYFAWGIAHNLIHIKCAEVWRRRQEGGAEMLPIFCAE